MTKHRARDEIRTADRQRWWRRRGRRHEDPTRQVELEPAHDQPWVPRSGLTDKTRRSPRQ